MRRNCGRCRTGRFGAFPIKLLFLTFWSPGNCFIFIEQVNSV